MSREIQLRPFPYPYDAMLAVANDIDFTTIDQFRTIHRFVNTTQQTELGEGVGLDVADSFWMYNLPAEASQQYPRHMDLMSYWHGTDTDREHDAEEIRTYIRGGWIDTLHSYGEFLPDDFSRDLARQAIEELADNHLGIEVWINHGGPSKDVNFTGFHGDHRGDKPGSAAYHTDLTLDYGIQYVWNSPDWEDQVGYDSIIEPLSLWDGRQVWAFRRYYWDRRLREILRQRFSSVFSVINRFYDTKPTTGKLASAERFADQVSDENLDQIVAANQFSIIAQHFGGYDGDAALPDSAIERFTRLKQRQDAGEVLVARTSRLLEYNRVREYLDYEYSSQQNEIDILAVDDPLFGRSVPSIEQLRGITFYTPVPERTTLRLDGTDIDDQELRVNPSDDEEPSIGIRWFESDYTDYSSGYSG